MTAWELKREIGQEIERIISDKRLTDSKGYPFDNTQISKVSRYLSDPTGQLLRPRILWNVSRQYSSDRNVALTCGAIVEIVHADTLALDDIMDGARKRRHKLATHAKFGLDRTILSCFNLNPKIMIAISSLPLDCDLKEKIREEINTTQLFLCQGQEIDLYQTKKAKTLDDFAKIFELKTGSLIGSAAAIGGMIGYANRESIEHLRRFGVYLGIAYQFFDDWKDRYCELHEVGKSVGLDKRKKTPFDVAKPEMIMAEYLRYCNIAFDELDKIKDKSFDELTKISAYMFSPQKPKAL